MSAVKRGYNDHGYSKYTVITNKPRCLAWFSLCYAYIFMHIENKKQENHNYNLGNCFFNCQENQARSRGTLSGLLQRELT